MLRKTLIGLAAAATLMGAAAGSANATYYGYGGYGYGGGYSSYSYDYCKKVIVGYRTKKIWRYGYVKFIEVPIFRTKCFY